MCYIQTMEIWLDQYGPQTQKEYLELRQILKKTEKKGRFSCCVSRENITVTDMKHGASITFTITRGLRFRLLMHDHYGRVRSRQISAFKRRRKQ